MTAIEILDRLVAFDTTSRLSNLALIEWVADYLDGLGLQGRLSYDDSGKKANLLVFYGNGGGAPLLLSGHTDVVPVDGQTWSSDPFRLLQRDGRLYGRGTCDMKGFIAVVLERLAAWQQSGQAQDLSLGLALSYDEEVGCLGVRRLLSDLKESGVEVSGCIVGEPTSMQPVIAHKGIAHYRCHVHGRAAHSSLTPQGVNAIEYAARLINHVRMLAEAEASFGRHEPLFDVPFNTLQTGWIQGGVAPNIVPKDCEFIVECRCLPGDDPERFLRSMQECAESMLPEMRKVAPEAAIAFEQVVDCPPFESPQDSALRDWVAELCAGEPERAVAYATEAGCFGLSGIPSVVCGPGSIEQAHRPDEFIEISQLTQCAAWLDRLAARQRIAVR